MARSTQFVDSGWKDIKPLPPFKDFCDCAYCKIDRCHYWTSLGRKMTGWSTPSWCPLPRKKETV